MDKDFVPYQPSLDMKSIGFDEPCFGQYAFKKLELINTPLRSSDLTTSEGNFIAAPTFSQAFRWFREKYQLHFPIMVQHGGTWYFEKFSTKGFKTYEEAELACLIKLIEIVKTK